MTNSKVYPFILLSLFSSICVFGNVYNGPTELSWKILDSLQINGPAKLKLVKAKSIDIKGPLEFHSLDVSGKADIAGTLSGEKGKFGQLNVIGTMEVDHVICGDLSVKGGPVKATYLDVTNHADIEGDIDAAHSKFKDLTIHSGKTVLDEVVLESIVVKKDQKNQVLTLKGTTIVNGDITFESGDGTVQVESPEVKIIGSIKGGIKKDTHGDS